MGKIKEIRAEKIIDSTGNWTVQATILTDDGYRGTASVPSGESVGKYEAKKVSAELSVSIIKEKIAPEFIGQEIPSQPVLDERLIKIDGTADKSNLGANSILVISEASAEAASTSQNRPLYEYLADLAVFPSGSKSIPTPLFNLIEGGAHARNSLDFQEFIAIPDRSLPFAEKLAMGMSIFRSLKEKLTKAGVFWGIGDEGGLSVFQMDNEAALRFLIEVITGLGLKPGKDTDLGLDAAAGQFYDEGRYRLSNLGEKITPKSLSSLYSRFIKAYPIIYLEDPFVEDSLADWTDLCQTHGASVAVVGDDLVATNLKRLEEAQLAKAITAVIIKPNQIGTVTETINFAKKAREAGLTLVASHRGAETSSSFIADLAVGIGAKYVKFGGLSRGERVAKYNRLLEIAAELGK